MNIADKVERGWSRPAAAEVPLALLYAAAGPHPRAALVWGVLEGRYADDGGESFPGRARLADGFGISVDTLDRAIRWLVDNGWLEVTPRYDLAGDRTSNLYRLLIPESVDNPPGGGRKSAATPPQIRGHGGRKSAALTTSEQLNPARASENAARRRHKGARVPVDPVEGMQRAARIIGEENEEREREIAATARADPALVAEVLARARGGGAP